MSYRIGRAKSALRALARVKTKGRPKWASLTCDVLLAFAVSRRISFLSWRGLEFRSGLADFYERASSERAPLQGPPWQDLRANEND